MKFPFQRYIVCWGKIYGSKVIGGVGGGGGGGRPEPSPLFILQNCVHAVVILKRLNPVVILKNVHFQKMFITQKRFGAF